MEKRSTKTQEKFYWVRTTAGNVYVNDERHTKGEVFIADPADVPKGALDVVKRCNKDGSLHQEPVKKAKSQTYEMQSRGKSKTWWDVLDGNGKRINDRALSKKDAAMLLKELQNKENE